MITIHDIEEAIQNAKTQIKTKNDSFLVLSSLNLLNASIKSDEYKNRIGYGFIKPAVSRLIQYCIQNNKHDLVDEICYDSLKKCAYIRCFSIQFSFHNINTNYMDQETVNIISTKETVWDGVRLQPVALELYRLAKECKINNINTLDAVVARFEDVII